MSKLFRKAALAAIVAGGASPVLAADFSEPPVVIEEPPVVSQPYEVSDFGGWYIRGDVDYHKSKFRGADYLTFGVDGPGSGRFDSGELKSALSVGGGVGYQMNEHFRTDLTLDYWSRSSFRGSTSGTCSGVPCVTTDRSSMSALLLMANAYVDIGTWHGFTPYVGAGIGGAHIKWDDLRNTIEGDGTYRHKGHRGWRFAFALMAGASYCLTDNLMLDAGYKFTRVQGGRMFEYLGDATSGSGPGFDKAFNTHEVRAGLRYNFGGGSNHCYQPETVAYEPPEPIYTK